MALANIDWFANAGGQSVTASLGGAELTGQRLEINYSAANVCAFRFCISLSLGLTLRIEQSLDSGDSWATLQSISLVADSGGRTYWSGWHTLSEAQQSADCLIRAMLVGIGSATFYYLDAVMS